MSAVVKPKVKVWVVFSDDMKFGEGRARLLEVIDERADEAQRTALETIVSGEACGEIARNASAR